MNEQKIERCNCVIPDTEVLKCGCGDRHIGDGVEAYHIDRVDWIAKKTERTHWAFKCVENLCERIQSKPKRENLFQLYRQRSPITNIVSMDFFGLALDDDIHARKALRVYAESVFEAHPEIAGPIFGKLVELDRYKPLND